MGLALHSGNHLSWGWLARTLNVLAGDGWLLLPLTDPLNEHPIETICVMTGGIHGESMLLPMTLTPDPCASTYITDKVVREVAPQKSTVCS